MILVLKTFPVQNLTPIKYFANADSVSDNLHLDIFLNKHNSLLIKWYINLQFIHPYIQLPILHKFRKSKTFISLFGALFLIFIMIACLPVGFPYKKDVAVQRVYVLVSASVNNFQNLESVKLTSILTKLYFILNSTRLAHSTMNGVLFTKMKPVSMCSPSISALKPWRKLFFKMLNQNRRFKKIARRKFFAVCHYIIPVGWIGSKYIPLLVHTKV